MDQIVKVYLSKIRSEILSGVSYERAIELKKRLIILEEIGLLSEQDVREWDKEILGNLSKKVEELNLSARAYNSLNRAGIRTKDQLRSEILNGRLLDIRNIGSETGREILLQALKEEIVKIDELSNVRMTKSWKKATVNLQAELKG